jgi:hypothetical protein
MAVMAENIMNAYRKEPHRLVDADLDHSNGKGVTAELVTGTRNVSVSICLHCYIRER